MSGGAFDYKNHFIEDIACDIELRIQNSQRKRGIVFSDSVEDKFQLAVLYLRAAGKMAHEIDYLLSSDTSERSFMERWKEDVEPLIDKFPNRY